MRIQFKANIWYSSFQKFVSLIFPIFQRTDNKYTVKPLFIVFVRGLKRNNGSGKTIDAGAIVEIGFARGPQKLNDGSGKMNYPGSIDRGFTVYENNQNKL
jgi:hypothetical protein